MDIALIECPGDRRVLLCGGVLVYAEDVNDPTACYAVYDAEFVAEAMARAAGVGVRVHRVDLPADFHVCDEDGPLPAFTAEHVRDWWVSVCEGQAEEAATAAPPLAYPTLQEQLLGLIGHAGLEVSDEVRRLAAELDRTALEARGDAMSETEAKQHLLGMLKSFSPGSVLHVLAQVIREAEEARLGGLDEAAEQRVREAEAFLWIAGMGLMSALPR